MGLADAGSLWLWTPNDKCIYTGDRAGLGHAVARKEKKKKNAQFVLRLNKDLRDRFVDACDDLDTSAAREVRRFIKKFLKRYEAGELDE